MLHVRREDAGSRAVENNDATGGDDDGGPCPAKKRGLIGCQPSIHTQPAPVITRQHRLANTHSHKTLSAGVAGKKRKQRSTSAIKNSDPNQTIFFQLTTKKMMPNDTRNNQPSPTNQLPTTQIKEINRTDPPVLVGRGRGGQETVQCRGTDDRDSIMKTTKHNQKQASTSTGTYDLAQPTGAMWNVTCVAPASQGRRQKRTARSQQIKINRLEGKQHR